MLLYTTKVLVMIADKNDTGMIITNKFDSHFARN